MLTPTLGQVLHTTNYSESSVIVKMFTRELGVRSYIIKGVRRQGSRTKQNLLQPLRALDLVVYNSNSTLNYVKEISPHCALRFPSEVENAILFFMTELLYKSLPEGEPMPELFDYVLHTVEQMDKCGNIASLPIEFQLRLASFLGIAPLDNYSINEPLFNLKEGRYLAPPSRYTALTDRNTDYLLDKTLSERLHNYLSSVYNHETLPLYQLRDRIGIINLLLEYYKVHLDDFGSFKSHEVLHSVLT